jgi:hypothetical protein
MWQDSNRVDVFEFVGCSDEAVNTYCFDLSLEERKLFQDGLVLLYRACLHIAVTGHASFLSLEDNSILAGWMRGQEHPSLRVSCGDIYFLVQKAMDAEGFEVHQIGWYC